jgi:ABC-2 type transport system ATP-binding protein
MNDNHSQTSLVYEVEQLVKIYPGQSQPANRDINLQIHSGEIFGLLGDNGAGKSTLVLQMANLIRSTSGSIRLFGQPVQTDPLHVTRNVGYMPQGGLALNNLTVAEAIYFTAHLRGLSAKQSRQERDYQLETWQLTDLASKSNKNLSGGQKRLLQLAVAMVARPPVLLLDEPTNDLDPQRRRQVWDNLRWLNHETGTTVIFITHDAIEAEKIIQRVGIIHQGRLVALGRPSELKARIDRKLRLELFFQPDRQPCLPGGFSPQLIDPGRWLLYLDREDSGLVLNQLNMDEIDDFRLYSATLEDLYLYYAQNT